MSSSAESRGATSWRKDRLGKPPPPPRRSTSLLGTMPTESAMKKEKVKKTASFNVAPQHVSKSTSRGDFSAVESGSATRSETSNSNVGLNQKQDVVTASLGERGGFSRMKSMFENTGNQGGYKRHSSSYAPRRKNSLDNSALVPRKAGKKIEKEPTSPSKSVSFKVDPSQNSSGRGNSRGGRKVSKDLRRERSKSVNSCVELVKEVGVGVKDEPKIFTETLRSNQKSGQKTNSRKANESGLICRRCNDFVHSDGINAMGHIWHRNCFYCDQCKRKITSKFSRRDGFPICNSCSAKKSAHVCNMCGKPIDGAAMVIDGSLIHPSCFSCAHCKIPIKGQYGEKNGKPYCMKCLSTPLVLLSLFKKR